MPGLNYEYFELFNNTIPLSDDMFGFYYCKIETVKDNQFGLLPFRTESTGLIFPTEKGSLKRYYFSEELRYAITSTGAQVHRL
jgi:hypothetical protein